jgi:hypothetical protein
MSGLPPSLLVNEPAAPPKHWRSFTPNDSATFQSLFGVEACRGLWVGTSGNIRVIDLDGNEEVIPNVPVGLLPGYFAQVKATSTTASGLLAVW